MPNSFAPRALQPPATANFHRTAAMSDMKQCEKKQHYYDASRHRRCPYCGIEGLDVSGTTMPPDPVARQRQQGSPPPGAGAPGQGSQGPAPQGPGPQASAPRGGQAQSPGSDAGHTRAKGAAADTGNTVPWWGSDRSAQGGVQGARQGDAGKPPTPPPIDPVVGWLVATQGPCKGHDYRIYAEANSIGRAPHHRIAILCDEAIHRDVNATLYYDPRAFDPNDPSADPDTPAFHLTPGTKGMVWVRRRELGSRRRKRFAVVQATPLEPYDIIQLGRSELMFVPFCTSQNFLWTWGEGEVAPEGAAEP